MTLLAAVGEPFANSCGVHVRSAVTGNVMVNGIAVPVDVNVYDGNGYIVLNNITDKQQITVTGVLGEVETLTLRTLPAVGEKWSFMMTGCYQKNTPYWPGPLAADLGCRLMIMGGDNGYMTQAFNGFGVNYLAAHDIAHDDPVAQEANVCDYYEQLWKIPGMRLMRKSVPTFALFDDHECRGDNWDHTLTQANSLGGSLMISQAEVDEHYRICNLIFRKYWPGNPVNNDSEAVAVKPSNAAAETPVGNYVPLYWRKRIGDVEIFGLDGIGHKSPWASADSSTKTILGLAQESWLINRVTASTAPIKIVIVHKDLFGNYNQDGFGSYIIRRDLMLKALLGNVTGMVWLTQDNHHPHVAYAKAGITQYADGSFYARNLLCVCGCPTNGAEVQSQVMTYGYTDSMIWKGGGCASPEIPTRACTYVSVDSDGVEISIIGPPAYPGHLNVLWRARVNKGSNALVRPKKSMGRM